MAYTHPWDATAPPDTQLAKLGAQDFRDLKVDIPQRLFLSGPIGSRPTPEAVFVGMTYLATDTNKLYTWSGTAWVDITAVIQGMIPTPPSPSSTADAVRVYKDANQSIPSAAWTAIIFNSERYDNNNLFTVGAPTKLICRTAGKHLITGHVTWPANATGQREVGIRLNGTGSSPLGQIAQTLFPTASGTYATGITASTIYNLAVLDYVELIVFQGSGSPLDVYSSTGAGAGNFSPEFMMQRLGT